MKFVYWTGCVNFHTIQVFEYLGISNTVIIAYCYRSFRGYHDIIVSNCILRKISSLDDCKDLIHHTSDFIHVNNAFKTQSDDKIMKDALKILVKKNYYLISLFQEQYPYKGITGILRRLKWIYNYKFGLGRKHRLIGYCGCEALKSLKFALVPDHKLFDFIYTPNYTNHLPIIENKIFTFIMVGQLVDRKSILETIEIFKSIPYEFSFKIIGDGELKHNVIDTIHSDRRFEYLGSMEPNKVQEEYSKSDVLILSSKFDGWGCSVNEALTQGCKVIVSDNCGSQYLIKCNNNLGKIFQSGNWNQLRDIGSDYIKNGPIKIEDKIRIIEWCNLSIDASVESEYLIRIFHSIEKSSVKPIPPWRLKRQITEYTYYGH